MTTTKNMRLRCAAYARFSSDRQSPASIEDQLRMCRDYATKQGWQLLEQHVYRDDAISGAGIDRPGLAILLDATSRVDRPFDVLLLDDTSRLSRNLADAVRTVEMLRFKGFRIVSVSQGIDSQNDQADVLMTVHGLVDSLYIKELAKKTHRGLQGRALKGLHTGGRCFGYDNVKDDDSVRYSINEKEADIVRRIFEMAADGASLKTVTKTLNRENVLPPRKRAKKEDASWCHNAIREMLRNELYIGRLIWNRSQFIKQPGTNKRLRRMRPESEWIVLEKPELRIIDDNLWHRVRDRIAWVNERYNHGNQPGMMNRATTSPNFLTGFLRCGSCGRNLIIVAGRGKHGHPRYGCPMHANRGVCSNAVRERADLLEELLFTQLQNAVLRPEAVEGAIQDFERELHRRLRAGQQARSNADRSEHLRRELSNLAATILNVAQPGAGQREKHPPTGTRRHHPPAIEHRADSRQPRSGASGSSSPQLATSANSPNRHPEGQGGTEKHVKRFGGAEADGKKGYYVAEGSERLEGTRCESGQPHFCLVAG
ncbi:MAG: recombinase family protein [Bryobacterales bacterium]|nr:recombinase family protein [Bryobacterales bacterium]